MAVPLATVTGWNPRAPATGAPDQLVDFAGSYLLLPKTAGGADPRRAISQRYPTREHYLGLIAESALRLVREGYLLPEDLPPLLERAREQWDWATRP